MDIETALIDLFAALDREIEPTADATADRIWAAVHERICKMTNTTDIAIATIDPILSAAAVLLRASESHLVPVSVSWSPLQGPQNGKWCITVRDAAGATHDVYGPVEWVRHGLYSAAQAMQYALGVLTGRGTIAVSAAVITAVVQAVLGGEVAHTERTTRGAGTVHTWTQDGQSVTLHHGHIMAPDEWLLLDGGSWSTVAEPVRHVRAALAHDHSASDSTDRCARTAELEEYV